MLYLGLNSATTFLSKLVQVHQQHHFIHFHTRFSSGEVCGASSSVRTGNSSRFSATSDSFTAQGHTNTGPNKVGDIDTPPGRWLTTEQLSRVCSQYRTRLENLSWGTLVT